MTEAVQVRAIQESDSRAIAALAKQLGYDISLPVVAEQVASIIANQDHFAFVAVREAEIIGFVHGFVALRLTASPFLEIAGLVVREEDRGKGIGSRLVRHLEEYVNHCDTVRVRCNVKRELAHRFYLKLDYSEKKEQKIFARKRQVAKANKS